MSEPRLYVFRDGRVLVDAARALPAEIPAGIEVLDELTLEEPPSLRVVVSTSDAPEGYEWKSLRSFFGRWTAVEFAPGGRAAQFATYLETNRFCGKCGHATEPAEKGRARVCPRCEHRVWPRLAPCVMVRIERDTEDGGRQILLARSPTFPVPFFSVLAGFVDPGETLEEAVVREVREEVGLEVRDVRYFESQPWPFPHSLMIAFTATYAGGEITVDGVEIAEADWYGASAMPMVPPPLSIAGRLIADFADRERRRAATLAKASRYEPSRTIELADGRRAELRLARLEDAAPLLDQERAVLADGRGVVKADADLPVDADEMRALLTRWIEGDWSGEHGAMFVVACGGEILGSATIRRHRPALVAHVAVIGIGVAPSAQRLRVGRHLMEQIVAWSVAGPGRGMTRIDLSVLADNARAVALYESMGWELEGRRARFVLRADGTTSDDLIMVLRLAR